MNKFYLCLLLLIPQYLCGQTYYYKLTKKIVDGVTYTNTAGGQFITFSNNFCFESDNKGNTVGNGLMAYSETVNGSLIYNGSCYFGSNSKFKFNNDRSVLNIVPSNGVIYIYRRMPAPNNQYTCTLIKKVENNITSDGVQNSTNTNVYPVYSNSINDNNNYGNNQQSQTERTPSKRWKTITRNVDCPHCAHSGKCSTCNGKGYYYSSFGLTKTVDCPNCDGFKTGRCRHCHGTGTITKTERVYE